MLSPIDLSQENHNNEIINQLDVNEKNNENNKLLVSSSFPKNKPPQRSSFPSLPLHGRITSPITSPIPKVLSAQPFILPKPKTSSVPSLISPISKALPAQPFTLPNPKTSSVPSLISPISKALPAQPFTLPNPKTSPAQLLDPNQQAWLQQLQDLIKENDIAGAEQTMIGLEKTELLLFLYWVKQENNISEKIVSLLSQEFQKHSQLATIPFLLQPSLDPNQQAWLEQLQDLIKENDIAGAEQTIIGLEKTELSLFLNWENKMNTIFKTAISLFLQKLSPGSEQKSAPSEHLQQPLSQQMIDPPSPKEALSKNTQRTKRKTPHSTQQVSDSSQKQPRLNPPSTPSTFLAPSTPYIPFTPSDSP